MAHSNPRSTGRHLDRRLTAVEQTLITLATKEDLRSAIAKAVEPLATRVEMRAALAEAVAPLATREEMHRAIAALATREEVYQAIREEGERTRRHFDVVAEDLRGDTRLLAEGQIALYRRDDDLRTELKGDIAQLDRRVMRLEAGRE